MSQPTTPGAEQLFAALRAGQLDVVRALLASDPPLGHARNEGGATPLLAAVYSGKRETATALVEAGIVPDLWEAAALGDEPRLRTLLAANPQVLNEYSPDGWTPLHLSVFFGRPTAAALLLAAGADLTAVSRNGLHVTPLQSALAAREAASAKLLLEAGADPNAHAGNWPPLHYAAHYGLEELTRELLQRGADPTARTPDGKTALDMAEVQGATGVAALLRSTPPSSG